jgi:predicted CoA-substrate-specific enzyme activase
MVWVAGIDVGASYTKVVIADDEGHVASRAMVRTGFRLDEAAYEAFSLALEEAGLQREDVSYIVSTGNGRAQVSFRDAHCTDLTACAYGAWFFYPETRTVLDVAGQSMKAIKLSEDGRVLGFRLNDKCAAGTGAFLEKTAYYMGYDIQELGELATTSTNPVTISSVCAVFAEAEVINHVTAGVAPADIMQGAILSLVDRSIQLLKRVGLVPQVTVSGGIMRFTSMRKVLEEKLGLQVNFLPDGAVQFTTALGAAMLGHRRLQRLGLGARRVAT